ncbi:MmyB family transcriptional regulator [Streptomyces sp. 7N604]|uniref:MmyB family transcriptional regulator n=1 Tax=Streptomyces sp. 7N604 TaxID=3457415 RepID=UPI003FD3A674
MYVMDSRGPEDRRALGRLLAAARAKVNPADKGLPVKTGRGHHAQGLSQANMDELTGRPDSGTYGKLERGQIEHPSEDYLRAVARALNVTDEQWWTALWRLAVGTHEPPSPLHPVAPPIPEAWQRAIDGITHPSYWTDVAWELKLSNAPWRAMFDPGEVPQNIMRFMALDEAARKKYFPNWENTWAVPVLAQLRAVWAAHHDNEVLAQLHEDVLADPVAGPIYRRVEADIQTHPRASESRPLYHAQLGYGRVTMCVSTPLDFRGTGMRWMILLFEPDAPDHPPQDPA